MARRAGSAAVQRWRDRMRRRSQSGVSLREFCAQEGVSEPSFYYWRRRLGRASKRRESKTSSQDLLLPPRFLPVEIVESADRSRSSARTITDADHAVLEVLLPSSVRLHLDVRIDEGTLRRVLRAVMAEARGC